MKNVSRQASAEAISCTAIRPTTEPRAARSRRDHQPGQIRSARPSPTCFNRGANRGPRQLAADLLGRDRRVPLPRLEREAAWPANGFIDGGEAIPLAVPGQRNEEVSNANHPNPTPPWWASHMVRGDGRCIAHALTANNEGQGSRRSATGEGYAATRNTGARGTSNRTGNHPAKSQI